MPSDLKDNTEAQMAAWKPQSPPFYFRAGISLQSDHIITKCSSMVVSFFYQWLTKYKSHCIHAWHNSYHLSFTVYEMFTWATTSAEKHFRGGKWMNLLREKLLFFPLKIVFENKYALYDWNTN